MNMKKWTIALALLLTMSMDANAQGFLKKLKDKAVEKVKDKIENKVERETDEVMDDVLDGKKKEKSSKKNRNDADDSSASASDEQPQATTSSDFKRGSVIMYQDDVTAEQVGEFPSKWDLFQGTVETKTLGGVKAINPTDNAQIQPLIKEQGAYLPEEFTIEYDFYYWPSNDDVGLNDIKLILAVTKDRSEFPGEGHDVGDLTAFVLKHGVCNTYEHDYMFNGNKDGAFEYSFKKGWNHVALSFNKRALKVYFNDKRVVNLPRVNQPTWMCFQVPFEYKNLTFIRNVVIAKGAVALYDRNAQDVSAVEKAIQETGKFVTNNILFDTGKATLKQQSMIEIMKVADYMKKNPNVRFEVQGHTDNQGSDKINDPLSQQRAEAIVKALEGLGVDGFNLRAVGKGSHEPVADNKTEAGRAKNRRVEFIKK
jgi:outer membrane protein OmpA-like peptidoglycan-associated protein